MIVRVMGEGQYDLEGAALHELKVLDQRLFAAVSGGDERAYRGAFDAVLGLVRSGRRVPDDRLVESDLILPAPDTSMEEARRLFTHGG
jgi:hypothetical protein